MNKLQSELNVRLKEMTKLIREEKGDGAALDFHVHCVQKVHGYIGNNMQKLKQVSTMESSLTYIADKIKAAENNVTAIANTDLSELTEYYEGKISAYRNVKRHIITHELNN